MSDISSVKARIVGAMNNICEVRDELRRRIRRGDGDAATARMDYLLRCAECDLGDANSRLSYIRPRVGDK